ncbi:glycosyltransferase family 2 protein [Thalassospira povalilytica]|uniref:glycosyltransferase family 2 protein n=1 Tax=Thalassospira povalilytica TaxID=732237 RepID=UPI003AA8A0B9
MAASAPQSTNEKSRLTHLSEKETGDLLDVVIVNYNTYDDTCKCVQHLLEQGEVRPENIYVVDNCSPDGSGELLMKTYSSGVNVILLQENRGFGAGVNVGSRAGRADNILILNPDCYPEKANIHLVLDHINQNPDVGIVGAELVNPDGSLQYSARTFYSCLDVLVRRSFLKNVFPFSLLNRSHLMQAHPRNSAFDVDWVMGTGLFVRRELFCQVGKMDEGYFLYMDDVDLCARVHRAGFRVQLMPAVKFIHDHRRQSGQIWKWTRAHSLHFQSLKLFAKRHGLPVFRRLKL